MNIWVKSALIGLAAAALLFILITSGSKMKKTFTSHYTVEVSPDPSSTADTSRLMDLITLLVKKRLTELDKDYTLTAKKKELDITVHNLSAPDLLTPYFTSGGKVEFWEVYNIAQVMQIIKGVASDTALGKFFGFLTNVYPDTRGPSQFPAAIAVVAVRDSARVMEILHDSAAAHPAPNDVQFAFGPLSDLKGKRVTNKLNLYALRAMHHKTAPLNNTDVASAQMDYNRNGDPMVSVQFSAAGTSKWAAFTEANINRPIAIVVNGSVVSAPTVMDRIDGGQVVIQGGFTEAETQSLASQLSTGNLPASLQILSFETKAEKGKVTGKPLLYSLCVFIIFGGLAWFIFRSLNAKTA